MAIGSARLPISAAGEQARVLMVELTVARSDGRIIDVATTISLPGYGELLRRLLTGHKLSQLDEATQLLCEFLRGPLLKPTIAALRNAGATPDRRGETS